MPAAVSRKAFWPFLKQREESVVRQLPPAHRPQSAARARLQGARLHRGDPRCAVDSRFACASLVASISPPCNGCCAKPMFELRSIRAWCVGWITTAGRRFEWTTTQLGSQSAVAAGGRYDGLVEQLGGPAIPGVGFAHGRRAVDDVAQNARQRRRCSGPSLYVVWVGEKARDWAFPLVHRLRQKVSPSSWKAKRAV